ncbi:MAG: transcriptional repressor LexA [Alphaproteobacteria bacterium]
MLTKKQRDLLLYIHETMSGNDIPPSFEEMKNALGLKSKSGIHRLISALVERGYIERLPHRARALQIKRLPDGFTPHDNDLSSAAHLAREIMVTKEAAGQSIFDEIPLYGRIAAGTPIEAIRDEGSMVQLPHGMIGTGEHYALTIDGNSMIKAGIHDQDTVIIKRCDTASNGEIVVALVDDLEVTLKRIHHDGKTVSLIPENDAHETRILDASRVKVQGKLASLIRTYH